MKSTLLLVPFLLLAMGGCYEPAPKTSQATVMHDTVSLGDAESVDVNVTIGVGELTIAGGASRLLDASLEYSIPDLRPKVSYEVKDKSGKLTVEQPSNVVGGSWPAHMKNDWSIQLSDSVPMDIALDLGVGKVVVNLGGLRVRRLKIEAGVGEGIVDLSGERPTDLETKVSAGVGKLTVVLPGAVGVRATVDGGIGNVKATGLQRDGEDYVNDAWGKSRTSIRLEIEGGIGDVELRLARDTDDSI
jgi:hypothetical protein